MKSTYRELVRQGFGFTNLNYTAVFSYDAAGRLVREGDKTYRYGYLDKVLSVTDGKRSYRYAYHVDGQLARADYGDGGRAGSPLPAGSEAFHWDGLALVRRGDESFVNEPHAGDAPKKLRSGGKPRAKRSARRARKGPRGNPVVSSKGVTYLNDALGTTVGARRGARYSAAALTAFGEGGGRHAFFTGKPLVEGLGRAFLMRNYRADLAKWQTADPLGYPDGWNPLAYCGNRVTDAVDLWGAMAYDPHGLNEYELMQLASAIDTWLEAANNSLYGLAGWVAGRPYTLSFLSRYMGSLGDQTLAYDVIAGETAINSANGRAIEKIKAGSDTHFDRVLKGGWADIDFETSLGAVGINYKVTSRSAEGIYVRATIDDLYDFHDQATVDFPFLDYFSCDWGGGNTIYDKWMKQLATAGYAQEFKTHIGWTLFIPE